MKIRQPTTLYIYVYNSLGKRWDLRTRTISNPRTIAKAVALGFRESALEAQRRAYEKCEKSLADAQAHVADCNRLIIELTRDDQWREHTPCRRCDGAGFNDFCKTHNAWCFTTPGGLK